MVLDSPPGSPDIALSNSGASATSDQDDEEEYEYDEDFVADDWFGSVSASADELSAKDGHGTEKARQLDPEFAAQLNKRIVSDIRQLRDAGFRVGIIKGMKAESATSILSASLRILKLGLSDEVLQAWNLERHHYITLLIQYSEGYVTYEDLLANQPKDINMSFRMGTNNRYKPTLLEAAAAFSCVKQSRIDPFAPGYRKAGSKSGACSPPKSSRSRSRSPTKTSSPRRKRVAEEQFENEIDLGYRQCFISSPMRQLMDDIFLHLVRIRDIHDCGWEGAKHHLRQQTHMTQLKDQHEYVHYEEIPSKKDLPAIVTADHVNDESDTKSLPLVAMQFAMVYLMRCTEFCLVCHKKTEESFEAIKPYVCFDPLCLYQYMSLGFGPSIEHEILTQPYVVDLLISFCYAAASADRLRGYPDGMGLVVPPPPPGIIDILLMICPQAYPVSVHAAAQGQKPKDLASRDDIVKEWAATQHQVRYDLSSKLIELDDKDVCKHLRTGDWIQLTVGDTTNTSSGNTNANYARTIHCKVEKYMHPFIHIKEMFERPVKVRLRATPDLRSSEFGDLPSKTSESPEKEAPAKLTSDGTMSTYSLLFDELEGNLKAEVIVQLLETLPTVHEMAEYLSQNGASDASLMRWVNRISPPALGLLRWIVASNRSCIVQVDQAPAQSTIEAINRGVRLDQRISGMGTWMQFRFAQGAPDKEDKFHKALESKKAVTGQYESIFAWHGSSLANWHSIIRNGLDYAETLNGRAYGHGVYFASEFQTSLGYCHAYRSLTGGVSFLARLLPPGRNPLAKLSSQGLGLRAWPQSSLHVGCAMALNELVNAPAEFKSSSPYYVVQFTEWIQCRYLLIQCTDKLPPETFNSGVQASTWKAGQNDNAEQINTVKVEPTGPFIVQDPARPITSSSQKILIPRCAFPSSRNFTFTKTGSPPPAGSSGSKGLEGAFGPENGFVNTNSRKKRKSLNVEGKATALPILDQKKLREALSDASDEEDQAFFNSEDEVKLASQSLSGLGLSSRGRGPATHDEHGKLFTDFVPGSLDCSTIPQLAPPPYGTSVGNRRLAQDLKALLAVQNATPVHELGWYVDGNSINNLYQWIIELHSFPADLPLANDMKKANMTSIVLEFRFGPTYPINPPFVRVIRPRFLSFMNGGGGHVTAGGAMCMQLLTNDGWSPVNTIESVLLQVRLAIMSTDPKPARLLSQSQLGYGGGDYGIWEAIDAYERACKTHGWKFEDMRGVGGQEVAHGAESIDGSASDRLFMSSLGRDSRAGEIKEGTD